MHKAVFDEFRKTKKELAGACGELQLSLCKQRDGLCMGSKPQRHIFLQI